MHVDDLASACLFLTRHYDHQDLINVGTGVDQTVRSIAGQVRDVVHSTADLHFDTTKPDGTPRKVLDVSRIHALGWRHTVELRDGLEATYAWYLSSDRIRGRQGARSAA